MATSIRLNSGPQGAGSLTPGNVVRVTFDLNTVLVSDFGNDTISDVDVTSTDAAIVIGDGSTAAPVDGATMSGIPGAPTHTSGVCSWHMWASASAKTGEAYVVNFSFTTTTFQQRPAAPLVIDIGRTTV